jgi:hypothetical protein
LTLEKINLWDPEFRHSEFALWLPFHNFVAIIHE